MGFQQGLSGLSAASNQLDVIGNNVANANTVGFKGSRAEFADMYATSFYGVAATEAGIGVRTAGNSQSMTQGNITPTNRSLDLAVNNNGFFIVKAGQTLGPTGASSGGTELYTRNGAFQVDRYGYIVNGSDRLQGWPANPSTGVITQGPVGDLQLQSQLIAPTPTTAIKMSVNLKSSDPVIAPVTVNPANTSTFNWSNATTVYDTLGNAHQLTLYYQKSTPTAAGTDWVVTPYVDGTQLTTGSPAVPQTFVQHFNTVGALTTAQPTSMSFTPVTPNGAGQPINFTLDLTNSTQYNQSFGTPALSSDGYAPGTLTGITVSQTGIIQASFSNSQTRNIGQVALANFTNPQGLQNVGGNRWGPSYASGPVIYNAPGAGNAGSIQSSALEDSNVDMTQELVNMITAQRYYQANAQTIKTEDQIVQTLINLH